MVSANFPRKGTHVRRKADGTIGEVYASDPLKDVLTVRWRTATGFSTQVCTSEHFARDWELTATAFNLPRISLASPGALTSQLDLVHQRYLLRALGLLFIGAIVLLIAYVILTPSSKTVQSPATAQGTRVAQPAAGTWDGIEGHPDCTPKGHQDPHDPGVTITDLDTENCPKGLLGSIKSESSIAYEVPSDVDGLADDVELLGKDITDDYFAGKITASQMNHISKQMKISTDDVYEGKRTGDFTKARTQLTKVKQMEMDAEKY